MLQRRLRRRMGRRRRPLRSPRQPVRIEREREVLKTAPRSIEVTWSPSSLRTEQRAGPEEFTLMGNHRHTENRLHYVRDFAYDEDPCRDWVRHLPRNLPRFTNTIIAIAHCKSRFGGGGFQHYLRIIDSISTDYRGRSKQQEYWRTLLLMTGLQPPQLACRYPCQ